MVFHRRNAKGEKEGKEKFEARFHVADIEVDAILFYPWLKSQQIGVFPHLDTLAKIHPEQKVLTPRSKRTLHQVTKEGDVNLYLVLQGPSRSRGRSLSPRCANSPQGCAGIVVGKDLA